MAVAKDTPAQQLSAFIAKFEPDIAQRIAAVRSKLRKRFPAANELVYDNYNFFVIGYSPTLRPSDTMVSIAANAKGVGLSFYQGASLPDPQGILQGAGSQNRFARLPSVDVLDSAGVRALLDAAEAAAKPPLAAKGKLIIRSVSAKQRPRRVKADSSTRKPRKRA